MGKKHVLDAEYRYMLMAGLFWFAQNIYNPYLTTYLTSIGISAAFAGTVVGAWGFTQLLGCFSSGLIADFLRSHWKVLCLGQCAMVAASLLLCTVQRPWVYLAAKLIAGITASTWSCVTTNFEEFSSRKNGSQNMSRMLLSMCGGSLIAYLLGALFYDVIGMRGLFALCGIAAVLSLLLLWSLQSGFAKMGQTPKTPVGRGIRTVFHSRYLWECAVIAALANAVIFSTTYSFIANYAKSLGAVTAQLAILSAMHTVGCLIGSGLMSGNRLSHFSKRQICICSYFLLASCCVIVPLSRTVFQLYLIQILYGIARDTPFGLLMAGAVQQVDPSMRATAMGLLQSTYSIGTTAGPILMGLLMEKVAGFTIPYLVFAGIALLCVVISSRAQAFSAK